MASNLRSRTEARKNSSQASPQNKTEQKPCVRKSRIIKETSPNSQPKQRKRHNRGPKCPKAKQSTKTLLPHPDEGEAPGQKPSPTYPREEKKSERTVPDNAVVHWSCQRCLDCPEGVFVPPRNSCIFCDHSMEDHDLSKDLLDWNPRCDFLSKREELVTAVLKLVKECGVVVIRATPLVGKTALLNLLGLHILENEPSLEPIKVHWLGRKKRFGTWTKYRDFLQDWAKYWREHNKKIRPQPSNQATRNIFLIDEAQDSYEEIGLWTQTLKGRFMRSDPLFILVCVHGSTSGPLLDSRAFTQPQAIHISANQRIELRPLGLNNGKLSMQFTSKETIQVVNKWAIENDFRLEEGVCDYIRTATNGHPGMIGLLLHHFSARFPLLPRQLRLDRKWTAEVCHTIVTDTAGFLAELGNYGRGVWTAEAELWCFKGMIHDDFKETKFSGIEFSDVIKALQDVAKTPCGLIRLQTGHDALELCHEMGFLHTEQAPGGRITYLFPSPIHQRVAYKRLFPGAHPEDEPDGRTLQQVCQRAIGGMSPSSLESRSQNRWNVPEAMFQDEMYRCLCHELCNLPILSEYSHAANGRVDFYVFSKRWGIEILQGGNQSRIMEHAARFTQGGKYWAWNVLEDFIIINFCTPSKLQKLEVPDEELQSRILQVAIDPAQRTAKVYSHDMQLKASYILSEGQPGSHMASWAGLVWKLLPNWKVMNVW